MDCVFCTIKEYVLENELAFAVQDKYPVGEGHMLIVPKRHVPSFFDTTPEEKAALLELLEKGRELVLENSDPDGMNIGINEGVAAGQTVMHLHIHLIPRYEGDIDNPEGGIRGAIPDKRMYR